MESSQRMKVWGGTRAQALRWDQLSLWERKKEVRVAKGGVGSGVRCYYN